MTKIAYISTYIPKKCGIATYTHNLRQNIALAKSAPSGDVVISIVDSPAEIRLPGPDLWYLRRNNLSDYRGTAERINQSDVSIVFLQHEFGIFGGRYGSNILELIKHLEKPLVTTFHTVSAQLTPGHFRVQKEIGMLSRAVFVMNSGASRWLRGQLAIPGEKIRCIPHGAPEPIALDREQVRRDMGWTGKKVMMSFGLLSAGKGFEFIINLLPKVIKEIPDCLYVIIGETHPLVKKAEGEAYRIKLQDIINMNNLQNHVSMLNQYVTEDELIKYLLTGDLVAIPYPGLHQSSSGVLSYSVGLGRPVLSTPFQHAQELLQNCSELLVPYGDEKSWVDKLTRMFSDPYSMKQWGEKVSSIGRSVHWPYIGKLHADILEQIV